MRMNLLQAALISLLLALALATYVHAGADYLSRSAVILERGRTVDLQQTADRVQSWTVTVKGVAYFGDAATDLYNSAVVQYITPSGQIDYAVVRIGGSVTVRGRNLHVFVADADPSDNRGSLDVTVR